MQPVRFVSTKTNQRMVLLAQEPIWAGNRVIGDSPGKSVQFVRGMYETTDAEEIELIRQRLSQGNAPQVREIDRRAFAPDHTETLLELVGADLDRVEEIYRDEAGNWQREPIMRACEKRLEGVQTDTTQIDAPYGHKSDGTPRKRPVPAHIAEKMNPTHSESVV